MTAGDSEGRFEEQIAVSLDPTLGGVDAAGSRAGPMDPR